MRSTLEARVERDDADMAARHTRALLGLTRRVWHPECTFGTALAEICRTAAQTLDVARTNVWRLDPASGQLACLHAYDLRSDRHAAPEAMETLPVDAAYAALMDQVRVIAYDDIAEDDGPASQAWKAYFARHGICSLLDAPVLLAGELVGVICHEQVGAPRDWNDQERAFAGSMGDFVAMAYEIVRRREAEREVRHLRLHDAATDLPNREFMFEALAQRMRLPGAADRTAPVVHVKATLPQGAPLPSQADTMDQLAARVAARLRGLVDERVQLARVRGDGFALVPDAGWSQREVVQLAERCADLGASAAERGDATRMLVSVGVAFAEPGASDARALMRQAEQAAEQALQAGGNRYQVYDAEHHAALARRLALEQALREAYDADAFEVHYQPEVDLETGDWLGAEALLRWRRDGAVVAAGEFIDSVESSGLVVPLGARVLERACRDAAAWPERADGGPRVLRVNLSARQFDAPSLAGTVSACLASSGLAPARLCLEITETTLVRDVAAARAVIASVRALGVAVAIDDFGTGYSSLSQLRDFAVDAIKIDRSFVSGLPGDRVDGAIIGAASALARDLGIEVVVEGVEREAQAQWLRGQGLRKAQGFLFAPALPLAELLARFARAGG